jgi:tetratricopeptide (TPR) repeat protein
MEINKLKQIISREVIILFKGFALIAFIWIAIVVCQQIGIKFIPHALDSITYKLDPLSDNKIADIYGLETLYNDSMKNISLNEFIEHINSSIEYRDTIFTRYAEHSVQYNHIAPKTAITFKQLHSKDSNGHIIQVVFLLLLGIYLFRICSILFILALKDSNVNNDRKRKIIISKKQIKIIIITVLSLIVLAILSLLMVNYISTNYKSKGDVEMHSGNFKGAIRDYTQAIKFKQNYREAYYKRGVAKDSIKDYVGAISDYNKAIAIYSKYLDAYISRGNDKLNFKNYQEAIKDFNQAIIIDPYNAKSFINRGWAKLKLEDYEEAIKDFNQAFIIDSNYLNLFFHNGGIKSKMMFVIVNNQSGVIPFDKINDFAKDYTYAQILLVIKGQLILVNASNYLDFKKQNPDAVFFTEDTYDIIQQYCK